MAVAAVGEEEEEGRGEALPSLSVRFFRIFYEQYLRIESGPLRGERLLPDLPRPEENSSFSKQYQDLLPLSEEK